MIQDTHWLKTPNPLLFQMGWLFVNVASVFTVFWVSFLLLTFVLLDVKANKAAAIEGEVCDVLRGLIVPKEAFTA